MISLQFKHRNQLNQNLKINKTKSKMKILRIMRVRKREIGKETRIKIKEVHELIIYVCFLYIIFYNVIN
jgi:hypothetical protein